MKITFLCTGKTGDKKIADLMKIYQSRVEKYCRFSLIETTDIKSSSPAESKKKESAQILKAAAPADHFILLDEKGKEFTSVQFSEFIAGKQLAGKKHLLFAIGGAYGFSEEVYHAAHEKISLSKMTMPHQLVRIIFLEQLYRGFTILNNEPYHH